MRLLVVTARYPTPDRPSAGAFVRDRLGGVEALVVAPRDYATPGWRRYASMAWRALTVRGAYAGIEGHFVLPSGALALVVARLRRLPLVVYAHGSDVRSYARRSRLHRWLARRVLRGADAVATNSRATAAEVERLAGVQARVIPPGVDLARFRPTPRPASRRVLYLGGDSAAKGVDIARRHAHTLAGPGLREVDPSQVPQLLSDHDVLLVPSREEGLGVVAIEAMAAGRWVVASDAGGLPEVVEDGINGTLVRGGDFAAALAAVPDYDPAAVAESVAGRSVERHRDALGELWTGVVVRRRD